MPGYTDVVCTKEDLVRLRDKEQNSWAKVAQALGLGSPNAARKLYSAVVRPHTESVLAQRQNHRTDAAGGGRKSRPVDLTGATLAQVRAAIVGRTIVVQRAKGTEEVPVAKVTSLSKGTVAFHDGDKNRSVKAAAIIATR
jgi:hypothetical protein